MRLLVSVRDHVEASAAIAGGARWIDLKEPAAGPLGAVAPSVAEQVARMVDSRCPVSAALGELSQWPQAAQLLDVDQLRVVKLGLAGCRHWPDWRQRWLQVRDECLGKGKQLAGVVYADSVAAAAPLPDEVIELVGHSGGKYLLIDTYDKQGLSSIDALGCKEFARLVHSSRRCGLTTVVAGRITLDDVPLLAALPIDILAVRGAVCQGDRMGKLDTNLVQEFNRQLLKYTDAVKQKTYFTTAE